MFSVMRLGLVDFGMTEPPCCRPQRSITWAGVLLRASRCRCAGSQRLDDWFYGG